MFRVGVYPDVPIIDVAVDIDREFQLLGLGEFFQRVAHISESDAVADGNVLLRQIAESHDLSAGPGQRPGGNDRFQRFPVEMCDLDFGLEIRIVRENHSDDLEKELQKRLLFKLRSLKTGMLISSEILKTNQIDSNEPVFMINRVVKRVVLIIKMRTFPS